MRTRSRTLAAQPSRPLCTEGALGSPSARCASLIVKDASSGILFQNNVVAFDVVEGEVVGNWYGRSPGAVRPKLKWVSEAIEAGDFAVSTARDRIT
jgi:hypothetical protein